MSSLRRSGGAKADKRVRVLFLVDSRDWAFERIARRIAEHVPSLDCVIEYYPEFLAKFGSAAPRALPRDGYALPRWPASQLKTFDAVVCFWYGTAAQCFECLPPTATKVMCLYDYCSWPEESPTSTPLHRERLGQAIAAADVVMYACPALQQLLQTRLRVPWFKLQPCVDGVALDCWPFKPVRAGAFSRRAKLRVGWVGNSQTHGGHVKRFAPLRAALEAKSHYFEFMFVDAAQRRVEQRELVAFYHSIDVYVCYSSAEGTPNPLLEAAACGRPFVSTNVGVVPLLLQEAAARNLDAAPGFAVSDKPPADATVDDLIALLMTLHRRRALLAQMSLSARAVLELGDWDWPKKVLQFERAIKSAHQAKQQQSKT